MPFVTAGGTRLHYECHGFGEPVVLVAGAGASGTSWLPYQVPALVEAGYRAYVYDSRGIPPSDECPQGFEVTELAADLAALTEHLATEPVRMVGTSMGAHVVQELALARPDLVRRAVLLAGRARSDPLRAHLALADVELGDSGVRLPPAYRAAVRALQMLSPRTMDDETEIQDWLALFEREPPPGPGVLAQLALQPMPDRRAAYADITVPCHVISFAHDLVAPPRYGRELADSIPGATFDIVDDAGHFGYLEQPDTVNKIISRYFALADTRDGKTSCP